MPFLRAGFNPKHRRLCWAKVGQVRRWVRLIEFRPSGDLCWHLQVRGALVWEAQVRTHPQLDAALRQALTAANQVDEAAPYCIWQLEHDHASRWPRVPAQKAA